MSLPSLRSALGVSAQPPANLLGVSNFSVLGVSSHRFLRPGVTAPGVAAPGVASHILAVGVVLPGISPPFGLPGVSSHLLWEGVAA